MSLTTINDVTNQIQKFWSPLFMKELRQKLLLGALVNKEYQGDLQNMGDRVRVSQINAPTGALKTVGTDADSFDSETLSTTYIDVTANKRAVASFEMEDLISLQSQIGAQDSEIRASLMYAIEKQVNTYLYSLISPSTSAPDHVINGVTDFNAGQIVGVRTLAAQAKWNTDKPWILLCDPSYYSDLLNSNNMISSDFVAGDYPVVGGQIGTKRFGFEIFEDNSLGTDTAYAFHPDMMHLVMQQEPRFKLSDLHAQKKFGYVLSVDMVLGAAQGIDHAKKVIKVYNT